MTNATPAGQPGWNADEARHMLDTAGWLLAHAAPRQSLDEGEDWHSTRDGWWHAYQGWQTAGRPLALAGETHEPTWEGHDPVSRRIAVLVAMNVQSPQPSPFGVQPLEFGEAVARAASALDEWVATGEVPHHPLAPIREYLTTHKPGALENYGDPVSAILAQVDWADDQVHRLRGALARPEYQTEMADTFSIVDPMGMAAFQVVDTVVRMLHEAADLIRDHKATNADDDQGEQAAEQLAEGGEPKSEVPDDWA